MNYASSLATSLRFAALGAAALLSLDAGSPAAAANVAGHYFDYTSRLCSHVATCQLGFNTTPLGNSIVIDRVSCDMYVSGASPQPIIKVELGRTLTGSVLNDQGGFLAPLTLVSQSATLKRYSMNVETMSVVGTLYHPVITIYAQGVVAQLAGYCHISGSLV